jgi:hypothetical protein
MCLLHFWIIFKILIPKKIHMMLALMFDPKIKDLFILNNYVRIEKATIVATRYDFKTLILFLYLAYQKVHPFA